MEPGAGNGTVSLTQEWTNCGIPGGSKAYAPRRRLAVGTIWTQNGWHSSKSWLSHCSGHQASPKKWLWLKIMLGQKRAIWNVVCLVFTVSFGSKVQHFKPSEKCLVRVWEAFEYIVIGNSKGIQPSNLWRPNVWLLINTNFSTPYQQPIRKGDSLGIFR